MTTPVEFELSELRSIDDEAHFFSSLGWFFSNPSVRRECGGYPLNDGPFYRWFVAKHKREHRTLGFASIEHKGDTLMWREGYVRAEARGCGLFRALRNNVLDYVDRHELHCTTRVFVASIPLLEPYGFCVRSTRGKWVTLEREQHVQ
ncbi:transcriptional regulator [Paraburkholderia sp. Ac-20342]|uniref:transcriptional regulator n=1 Tax=Paraburkholderia sp. Ac-20342 TaxID=2703889 RepID=UPI00198026FF|nr:transcriptional regulator [Paraburkholderia sp. Ac-20342]MBN3846962.1 transcriptional regulator [Paraburkholderia sp. Ac-20342]